MEQKQCIRCKGAKPIDEFGPDARVKKDGKKAICRACDREIHNTIYLDEAKREDIKKRTGAYYYKKRRADLKQRQIDGQCSNCDAPAAEGKVRCEFHDEKANREQRARTKKYMDDTRRMIYAHYGETCACCGESIRMFLTIDHINGGGAEHRREINRGKKYGGVYTWLRRSNFPEGFQTLCFNCNCGRERNGGICPHKANA